MCALSRAEISRRKFAGICIGTAAGAAMLDSVSQAEAQSVSNSIATSTIDQNPIRRRGIGLRALDAARAHRGLTLFSPMDGDGLVYLIDLAGKVVHNWKMPYPPGLYGYLTENGTLFYNGKIPNDTFLGKAPFKGGVALEADWNGRVLWEVRHPNHHHDGRLLKNGNVLLMCATELPDHIARKVKGGRPGTEEKGKIWADYLVEMTKDGQTVWEWRSWEHLDPAKDTITEIQGERSEWTHGNAVIELSDGNLLVSFRDISTIVKIERRGSWARLFSQASTRPPRYRMATS